MQVVASMDMSEMQRAGQGRLTRHQVHVLLKMHGIPHDPGEVRAVMAEMLAARGIPEIWPPPRAATAPIAAAVPTPKRRGRPPKKRNGENAA